MLTVPPVCVNVPWPSAATLMKVVGSDSKPPERLYTPELVERSPIVKLLPTMLVPPLWLSVPAPDSPINSPTLPAPVDRTFSTPELRLYTPVLPLVFPMSREWVTEWLPPD